jgi:hypothetical protein
MAIMRTQLGPLNRIKATIPATRNLRRENHYLPVCYQLGFADEQEKVWVLEAGKSEAEYCNPESVGRLRNLYTRTVDGREDDHIETFFAAEVETGFGLALQKIKSERAGVLLSGVELGYIARFVAAQAVRTVAHKLCVDEQAGVSVFRETYLGVMCRQLHAIISAWSQTLPGIQFLTTLPYVTHHFITGDNPVVVMNDRVGEVTGPPTATPIRSITNLSEILANPTTVFAVTLTPYMAVMLGQKIAKPGAVEIVPLDPVAVLKMNGLVRGQSQLFTLARDKEPL